MYNTNAVTTQNQRVKKAYFAKVTSPKIYIVPQALGPQYDHFLVMITDLHIWHTVSHGTDEAVTNHSRSAIELEDYVDVERISRNIHIHCYND